MRKSLKRKENLNISQKLYLSDDLYWDSVEKSIYKCQVQSKNAPECSAKVHHLVTPIC